jgi:hypothetical protein
MALNNKFNIILSFWRLLLKELLQDNMHHPGMPSVHQ